MVQLSVVMAMAKKKNISPGKAFKIIRKILKDIREGK